MNEGLSDNPDVLDKAFACPDLQHPFSPIMDALMAEVIPTPGTYNCMEGEREQLILRRKLFGNAYQREYSDGNRDQPQKQLS